MFRKQLIFDLVILIILIQFLDFFSLTLIPGASFFKYQAVIGVGLLIAIIAIIGLLFFRGVIQMPIDRLVLLFIFSMFLSGFMAKFYWGQSIATSIKGYMYYCIYFIYFVFVIFKIEAERVERLFIILFLLSLIVFLVDYVTFPNPLFSWRDEERRNGITIFFSGQGFTFLGAFYFLNLFFHRKNPLYLLLFVFSFASLFFLTQSRMNLLALIFGFFFILIFSEFKRKYLLTFALIIAGGIFYFTSNIFNGIKEASSEQSQNYKEDIRVLAHTYFLTELQKGVPTMLFGNGVPGVNSNLSLETIKGNLMGYWTADVGLTGIFSYFGLFGLLIWIYLFYYVFKLKNTRNSVYLKAYFLTLLTTALTGYSIFDSSYMPATIIALYLIRCETSIENEDVIVY